MKKAVVVSAIAGTSCVVGIVALLLMVSMIRGVFCDLMQPADANQRLMAILSEERIAADNVIRLEVGLLPLTSDLVYQNTLVDPKGESFVEKWTSAEFFTYQRITLKGYEQYCTEPYFEKTINFDKQGNLRYERDCYLSGKTYTSDDPDYDGINSLDSLARGYDFSQKKSYVTFGGRWDDVIRSRVSALQEDECQDYETVESLIRLFCADRMESAAFRKTPW